MIKEDAPAVNVGSGNIAGAGVGPQGEPGVSPKHQPKKNRSTPTAAILGYFRRKAPNQLAEVSQDLANRAHAYSLEKSQAMSNVYAVDAAKKSYKTTDRLKSHITRKWGKKGAKQADKHYDDYFHGRVDEETFAGATVFEVNSKLFHSLTLAKRKGKHWRTYLEEDDCYAEIREWANKHPKGKIVVRNECTGEMRYMRH